MNIIKNRVKKCEYGYIAYQKRFTILRTIIYFAVSLFLYLGGRWTTGTNVNLLTVVAVLGCLPASKSLVNVIMFLRVNGCSEELHEKIVSLNLSLDETYDMVLTSYEKSYELSHLVVRGLNVCGYTERVSCDAGKAEEHLEMWFKKNGFRGLTYKIFKDESRYLERLQSLSKLEVNGKETEELKLVKELSL